MRKYLLLMLVSLVPAAALAEDFAATCIEAAGDGGGRPGNGRGGPRDQ